VVGDILENLKINFYQICVSLELDDVQLMAKIKSDFSHFVVDDYINPLKMITITAEKKDYLNLLPTNEVATKQTENSIYYDIGNLRYNDFYGKALSIMDYERESVRVYYTDEGYIHELLYLLILSRTGKHLDLSGKHKVHAFGVNTDSKNLLLMMGSKGGKTSLFCELLTNLNFNIISDDTPVITLDGRILPCPLRIGLESEDYITKKFPYINTDEIYSINREHYNKKYLLPVPNLKNEICSDGNINILIQGYRSTFSEPKIVRISRIRILRHLIEHMIIGIGLPMVVEYFLRNTPKEHLSNFTILFSRIRAAIRLSINSKPYAMYFSSDIKKNADALNRLIHEV
jgi:hypothetical protein